MSHLIWRGEAFRKSVHDEIAARLAKAGAIGVQVARQRVPVATGRTRASIGYTFDRSTMTIQIFATSRWAVFIEMGTSRMPARPFLRPALAAVGRAFGGGISTEMGLPNAPPGHASRPRVRRVRFRAKGP